MIYLWPFLRHHITVLAIRLGGGDVSDSTSVILECQSPPPIGMCSTCCNRSGTGTAITYICYMYIYTYASLFSPTHMFSSTRNTTDRSTCLAIASVTDDGWTGTRECVRSGIVEVLVVIERRRSAPTPMLGRQFGVEIWSGPDAFFGLLQDVAGTLRGVRRSCTF